MDLISVLDVVESVARHVPTPEAWKDGILKSAEVPVTDAIDKTGRAFASEFNHRIKIDGLNAIFLSAYQLSNAAAVLDQYLHSAAKQGPRWFDWGQTGLPKLSEAARDEAMAMLVHMAGYFDRSVHAYQFGKFDNWPKSCDVPSYDGQFKQSRDRQRLKGIGFERTELINFLDRHEIPYSMGLGDLGENFAENSALTSLKHIDALERLNQDAVRFVNALGDEMEGGSALKEFDDKLFDATEDAQKASISVDRGVAADGEGASDAATGTQSDKFDSLVVPDQTPLGTDGDASTSSGTTIHTIESKERRSRLDDLLDQAISDAGSTYKTASVWRVLKEFAIQSRQPFTGGFDNGSDDPKKKGGLYYDAGHAEVGTLTESMVDSRLIRRWKKLGHKTNRR